MYHLILAQVCEAGYRLFFWLVRLKLREITQFTQ